MFHPSVHPQFQNAALRLSFYITPCCWKRARHVILWNILAIYDSKSSLAKGLEQQKWSAIDDATGFDAGDPVSSMVE